MSPFWNGKKIGVEGHSPPRCSPCLQAFKLLCQSKVKAHRCPTTHLKRPSQIQTVEGTLKKVLQTSKCVLGSNLLLTGDGFSSLCICLIKLKDKASIHHSRAGSQTSQEVWERMLDYSRVLPALLVNVSGFPPPSWLGCLVCSCSGRACCSWTHLPPRCLTLENRDGQREAGPVQTYMLFLWLNAVESSFPW